MGNGRFKKGNTIGSATQFQTGGEQAVIAQMGGIASGKARRDKRSSSEIVNDKIKAFQSNGQNLIENSLDMIAFSLSKVSKLLAKKELTLKECLLLANIIKILQSLAGEDTLNINNNVIEPPKFYFTAPDENEKK